MLSVRIVLTANCSMFVVVIDLSLQLSVLLSVLLSLLLSALLSAFVSVFQFGFLFLVFYRRSDNTPRFRSRPSSSSRFSQLAFFPTRCEEASQGELLCSYNSMPLSRWTSREQLAKSNAFFSAVPLGCPTRNAPHERDHLGLFRTAPSVSRRTDCRNERLPNTSVFRRISL